MPTINQLVRHGRQKAVYKSKSPALTKRWNSLNVVKLISILHIAWCVYPGWNNDTET